jgi:hypothetical protein
MNSLVCQGQVLCYPDPIWSLPFALRVCQVWWYTPIIPATWETEGREGRRTVVQDPGKSVRLIPEKQLQSKKELAWFKW